MYGVCAYLGTAVCGNDDAKEAVYNRMIDGFARGQLSLARDLPAGLAQLQDPYDPEQNWLYRAPPYSLYDLSYYRGKLYAYFGPAPALLLFGPYYLLTGQYLSYKAAAVLFCALGFLVAAWLFLSAQRRYAPDTPEWVMAVLFLTVGLAAGVPTLLARVDIWEMPIAGATALILCVVVALWQAWHQPAKRAGWLATASLGLGLAVATRPTAILDVPILILPLIQEWRENRCARGRRILVAVALPLLLCLGALALYNEARFGNPLEFGQTYQLAGGEYVSQLHQIGFNYVWENVRIYFLNFTPWKTTFPFIGAMPKIALHAGHAEPEFCFGILGNVPIVLLALAALWVRKRKDGLAFLAGVVLWIAVAQIGLLLLFFGAVSRYEVEFLTPLLCLAAIGLLAAEAQHICRSVVRGLWVALAAVSVAFNLCHAADHAAWARTKASFWFVKTHQTQAALEDYNILLLLEPPRADLHNARGIALGWLSRWPEAIAEFETAIRLEPGNANAHCNLGIAYLEEKKPIAAIGPLQESLRLNPNDPSAQTALASALQILEIQSKAASRQPTVSPSATQ
jgi:tetratricopeptide (TPR) repeat protein